MNLPKANEDYAEKTYWDERYCDEESFDWFVKYDTFRDLAIKTIHHDDRILNLGCGNSELSTQMYNDGFHNIVNVDYSEVVIESMRERHKSLAGMSWTVMDIRDMSELESHTFDVVLEKGTLDALLVEETDPWNVSETGEQMIDTILSEISRLLKPGGRFVSITFAQPHFRLPLYAQSHYHWNTQTEVIGTDFHYFFYSMTKGQTLSERDQDIRAKYLLRKCDTGSKVIPVSDSDDEDYLLKSVCVYEDLNADKNIICEKQLDMP